MLPEDAACECLQAMSSSVLDILRMGNRREEREG